MPIFNGFQDIVNDPYRRIQNGHFFAYNGIYYVITEDINAHLVIAKSTTKGTDFWDFSIVFPNVNVGGDDLGIIRDGTTIWIVVISTTPYHLKVYSFDLTTETLTLISTSPFALTLTPWPAVSIKLRSDKSLVIVWDEGFTEAPDTVFTTFPVVSYCTFNTLDNTWSSGLTPIASTTRRYINNEGNSVGIGATLQNIGIGVTDTIYGFYMDTSGPEVAHTSVNGSAVDLHLYYFTLLSDGTITNTDLGFFRNRNTSVEYEGNLRYGSNLLYHTGKLYYATRDDSVSPLGAMSLYTITDSDRSISKSTIFPTYFPCPEATQDYGDYPYANTYPAYFSVYLAFNAGVFHLFWSDTSAITTDKSTDLLINRPDIGKIQVQTSINTTTWNAATTIWQLSQVDNPQFVYSIEPVDLVSGSFDNFNQVIFKYVTRGIFGDTPGTTAILTLTPTAPITLDCPSGEVTIDVPFDSSFVATGGTPPYTFAIIAGTLPPGLSLDASTGEITGIPTTEGTYTFTGQVTDSLAATATTTCTKVIIILVSPLGPTYLCRVIPYYNLTQVTQNGKQIAAQEPAEFCTES